MRTVLIAACCAFLFATESPKDVPLPSPTPASAHQPPGTTEAEWSIGQVSGTFLREGDRRCGDHFVAGERSGEQKLIFSCLLEKDDGLADVRLVDLAAGAYTIIAADVEFPTVVFEEAGGAEDATIRIPSEEYFGGLPCFAKTPLPEERPR